MRSGRFSFRPHRMDRGRRSGLVIWVVALAGALFLSIAWISSSPIGSSPDEPDHIAYAWGTATGQTLPWNAAEQVGARDKVYTVITLPNSLNQYPPPACYVDDGLYDTSCTVARPTAGTTTTISMMAKYPLAYYAVIGGVLRLGLGLGLNGFSTLFLASLTSAMLSFGALLVSAALLGRRFNRVAAAGAVAATAIPLSQFLFATINPNGWEISGLMLLASLVICVRHDLAEYGRASFHLQISLVLLTFVVGWTRPLSVAWAGLLLLVLLLPVHGARRPALFRLAPATIAVLVTIGVFLLAWMRYQATGTQTETSVGDPAEWEAMPFGTKVFLLVTHFGDMVISAFGTLGWLDTRLPSLTYILWWGAAGALIAGFLAARPGGHRQPSIGPALFMVLGSGLVIAVEGYLTAFAWQGRYWSPALAAATVLLVPAMSAGRLPERTQRSLGMILAGVMTLVLTVAFTYNINRYRYGFHETFVRFKNLPYAWRDAVWTPVIGMPATIISIVLGIGLLIVAACVFVRTGPSMKALLPAGSDRPEQIAADTPAPSA